MLPSGQETNVCPICDAQVLNLNAKKKTSRVIKKGVVGNSFGPGTYYIGDPCYVMKDEFYDGVWGKKHGYESGVYNINGVMFAVDGTAYGDGDYNGSDGKRYGVDSGTIGVVPKELWDEKGAARANSSGRVVTVGSLDFYAKDGVFEINIDKERLVINTKEDEEDEEDDRMYGEEEEEEDNFM
jgi:hypothetical protein